MARRGPWSHYGSCDDHELAEHCEEFGEGWTPDCVQHPLAPNLNVYVCEGDEQPAPASGWVYLAGGAVVAGGLLWWWLS